MKAILVVDMPTTCEECELDKLYNDIYIYCKHSSGEGKNPSCPLKPLPQKKDIDKTLAFGGYENIIQESLARGYNACLEEITK